MATFTPYGVPPPPNAICGTQGITVGPDNNLWFTMPLGDVIGSITTTGTVTEFPQLSPKGSTNVGPVGITAGPDHNLWVTDRDGNKIWRISPSPKGGMANFPIPTAASRPWGITVGSDGNLWFTEHSGNKIGRSTIRGVITEFPMPFPFASLDITTGPDGRLWFTMDNFCTIEALAFV